VQQHVDRDNAMGELVEASVVVSDEGGKCNTWLPTLDAVRDLEPARLPRSEFPSPAYQTSGRRPSAVLDPSMNGGTHPPPLGFVSFQSYARAKQRTGV